MTNHRNRAGFTLVELMFSVLIAAIIALTLVVLIVMPYRSLKTNEEYAQVRRDVALAVGVMAKDIRESSFNNITTAANLLVLPPVTNNDTILRAVTIKYVADTANGTLTKYIDDVNQGEIVNAGLQLFTPTLINNPTNGLQGVTLRLEMENDAGDIAVVDETFIHARNGP